MLTHLQLLNKKLIHQYAEKNDVEKLLRQYLIEKILSNPSCFFDMDIDTSLALLADLGLDREQALVEYSQLIGKRYYDYATKYKKVTK